MTSRADYGDALANTLAMQPRTTSPFANILAMSGQTSMQTPNLKDDELLRHHYMNIAENKAVENEDGSLSTVYSIQVNHPGLNDGKPTLIPSVWDGEILTKKDEDGNPMIRPDGKWDVDEDAAAEKAIATGRRWTTRDTHEELDAWDRLLHKDMHSNTTREEAQNKLLNWAR
jgi:hypothetical protein